MSEVKQDMQSLLAAHWEAKHAVEYWKQRELELRNQFADFLCRDEDGYKNKTIELSGGVKLALAVKREVKVAANTEKYRDAMTRILTSNLCTQTQLAKFRKEKQRVEFNLTGYRELPQAAKEALGDCVNEVESVSINYNRQTDDR